MKTILILLRFVPHALIVSDCLLIVMAVFYDGDGCMYYWFLYQDAD